MKISDGHLCPHIAYIDSRERHKEKSKNTVKLKKRGPEVEGTTILVDIIKNAKPKGDV